MMYKLKKMKKVTEEKALQRSRYPIVYCLQSVPHSPNWNMKLVILNMLVKNSEKEDQLSGGNSWRAAS